MEKRNKAGECHSNDELKRRFINHGFEKRRSPRDEVIEILAEGLWALICQGHGPVSRDLKQSSSR